MSNDEFLGHLFRRLVNEVDLDDFGNGYVFAGNLWSGPRLTIDNSIRLTPAELERLNSIFPDEEV